MCISRFESPAGLLLTAYIYLVYTIALRFEGYAANFSAVVLCVQESDVNNTGRSRMRSTPGELLRQLRRTRDFRSRDPHQSVQFTWAKTFTGFNVRCATTLCACICYSRLSGMLFLFPFVEVDLSTTPQIYISPRTHPIVISCRPWHLISTQVKMPSAARKFRSRPKKRSSVLTNSDYVFFGGVVTRCLSITG